LNEGYIPYFHYGNIACYLAVRLFGLKHSILKLLHAQFSMSAIKKTTTKNSTGPVYSVDCPLMYKITRTVHSKCPVFLKF